MLSSCQPDLDLGSGLNDDCQPDMSWSFSRPQLVIKTNSQDKYSPITHTRVSQHQNNRETKHGKTHSILCYIYHHNSLPVCNIWGLWWKGELLSYNALNIGAICWWFLSHNVCLSREDMAEGMEGTVVEEGRPALSRGPTVSATTANVRRVMWAVRDMDTSMEAMVSNHREQTIKIMCN